MFKIFLNESESKIDTKVIIDAESENEALKIFKAQVVYKKGISKNNYLAEKV